MKGIPLVITYHPLLKHFASVIRKRLYSLFLNKQVKEILTPGPVVSSRGTKKLGSYLVGAKLYLLERSVRSFKCNGKWCQVYLNVTEKKHFQVPLLGKSIKLTTNLIAMTNVLTFLRSYCSYVQ